LRIKIKLCTMKSNYWNLVFGAIGVIIIANSLINFEATKSVFGFELNIWVYIGFWALASISSFFTYFKRKKEETEN